jgi:hypothetical protein
LNEKKGFFMKRVYDDDDDEDNDMDIDYGDVLGGAGLSDTPAVPSASSSSSTGPSLVSMGLPEGVDLNLTRGDFHNDEIFYAYKRMASFLAIALYVEHHEPLQRGDFCFGQEITDEQLQEEVFFPPASDRPPKLHL